MLSSNRDGRPFGHNRHGPKIGGCAPLGRRSWVPIEHNVAWAEAYLPTEWYLDPSSHLATTDMGQKLGDVPFWRRGSVTPPSLHTCKASTRCPCLLSVTWMNDHMQHCTHSTNSHNVMLSVECSYHYASGALIIYLIYIAVECLNWCTNTHIRLMFTWEH